MMATLKSARELATRDWAWGGTLGKIKQFVYQFGLEAVTGLGCGAYGTSRCTVYLVWRT
jgi:hypothetical protein